MDIGDSQTAADYALKLLTDSALYQSLRENMLHDIAKRFDSQIIADQYEHYYKK